MTPALQIQISSLARRFAFGWRYGELHVRVVRLVALALLSILAASLWHGLRLHGQIGHLEFGVAKLQSELDAKSSAIQAAQPNDFAQTLPASPSVAQAMQTLQQAAATEGARVESLQADDHPSTNTALGHLDLTLSIKAPYPSILVVLQQVLDRYPGATLRQLDLARVVAPATVTPMAPAPVGASTLPPASADSEAHVLLSFWRRPSGAGQAPDLPAPAPATSASGISAPAIAAASNELPASAAQAASPSALPSSGGR